MPSGFVWDLVMKHMLPNGIGTMTDYYTGVGSRETPPLMIILIRAIAEYQSSHGLTLRSGHAPGADQAFEWGAGNRAEIYLPWPSFEVQTDIQASTVYDEPTEQAMRMARRFHPAWERLGQGGQKLHARNCHQVLGYDLQTPSKYVICWTKDGLTVGGTATAIKIADKYCIPVLNLGKQETLRSWQKKLGIL